MLLSPYYIKTLDCFQTSGTQNMFPNDAPLASFHLKQDHIRKDGENSHFRHDKIFIQHRFQVFQSKSPLRTCHRAASILAFDLNSGQKPLSF